MAKSANASIIIRDLGRRPYIPVWESMKHFTDHRDAGSTDEIWMLQHDPVFTQGQAGKAEHVLVPGNIPVIQVDRGGQVTYHGPGQVVAYVLLDIQRLQLGVRDLVSRIEQAVVDTLADYEIEGAPRADAPGVYVGGAKIASLGLRIRRGCSFHGVSLNVDMDLDPFQRINPCGHAGLPITQMSVLAPAVDIRRVNDLLARNLVARFGKSDVQYQAGWPAQETRQ